MDCCSQCEGIEEMFDAKNAAKQLKRYRKKGPIPSTKRLIQAMKKYPLEGRSLLDIGGGIGAIQHELIKAGVSSAVGVDASSGYLRVAAEEAGRQGHADRIDGFFGDFVDKADEVPDADFVTLDRVICCYHDVEQLVRLSAKRARKAYGLVFPNRNIIMRIGFAVMNFGCKIRGSGFRVFLHEPDRVDELLREAGLVKKSIQRMLIWQVWVYERAGVQQ